MKKWAIVGTLLVVAGCSSSTGSTAPDAGSATPPSSAADTPDSCSGWDGTCASTTCPNGLYPVRGGGGGLCAGALAICCTPGSAGSRIVKGSAGLLCTADSFSELAGGTCAGASCAVGGECRGDGTGGMCDLSRGLPPTKKGSIECAIFGCGSITCAVGCSCKDAATSTCSCP